MVNAYHGMHSKCNIGEVIAMGDTLLRPLEELSDGFTMDMQEFLCDRMERIAWVQQRGAHRQHTADFERLHRRLGQEIAEDETRKKLEELIEMTNELEAQSSLAMYRQGFSEGIRFIMEAMSARP